MTETMSLRDRKKVDTRDRLSRAGFALSVEHGYQHVTTADIADQADVSRRTFSNYFSSKADCVAQAVTGQRQGLIPAMLAEPGTAPIIRRVTRVLTTRPDPFWSDIAAMHRICRAEPDVMAARARVEQEEILGITDDLVARSGGTIDPLKMQVTISAVIACFNACLDYWLESGSTSHDELADLVTRHLDVVDLSWLEPHIADITSSPDAAVPADISTDQRR